MAEYFKIINSSKKQYLEPFSLRSSEKFPALMMSEDMMQALGWLVCASDHSKWRGLVEDNPLAQEFAGSWSGDKITIIGDYESAEWTEVRDSGSYRDISPVMLAIMMHANESYLDSALEQLVRAPLFLKQLGAAAMLDGAPEELVNGLAVLYPDWKAAYRAMIR